MSEPEPPPKLFTPLYWAALAFGLGLILSGATIGLLGPHWLAHHHAARPHASAL